MKELRNILAAVASAKALAALFERRRDPEAMQAIPLCERCQRTAKRKCRAHGRLVCGSCKCPDCSGIVRRVRAGTPRTPQNPAGGPIPVAQLAPPLAHDGATCKCPWCADRPFDGPAA